MSVLSSLPSSHASPGLMMPSPHENGTHIRSTHTSPFWHVRNCVHSQPSAPTVHISSPVSPLSPTSFPSALSVVLTSSLLQLATTKSEHSNAACRPVSFPEKKSKFMG